MLDVARLVRVGDDQTASAAYAAAESLASHRAAQFVANWLVENGGPDPDPAALDAGTGGALTRLATLTASSRQKLLPRLRVRTFAGQVVEVTERSALVIGEDGQSLSIPATESSSEWVKALVFVDIEDLPGGATTLWVRSAFDPDADPNERVLGGPHILTPAERERLAVVVASTR
jgi:hypothetical protein